jgi:hypothetical protein
MAGYNQVIDILKQLTPGQVIDMCDLEHDTESTVMALEGYVEDNLATIIDNLVVNGLLEELEDE